MSKSTSGGFAPAKKPVVALVVAVALALLLLVVLQVPSRPAHAATDRLPDLRMLHPKGLEVQNKPDGRKLLVFASIIVNVGEGKFELGNDATTLPNIEQRIFDDAGGSRYVPTSATMVYGRDGHNHWHVTDLMDFELERLDNGSKVGTWRKLGFCFFDNYRFGSSEPAYYLQSSGSCGPRTDSATATSMGLSPGWGDKYGKRLPDQNIDITGLTPGRYRLIGTADKDGLFVESDNANNVSWVEIQLTTDDARIVAKGPSA
jgi:hypothetical protein